MVRVDDGESFVHVTSPGSGARTAWVWDKVGSLAAGDYPIQVRAEISFDALVQSNELMAHVSGGSGSQSAYSVAILSGRSLVTYINGQSGVLGSASFSHTLGLRYHLLLEIHAGGVRHKIWPADSSEPVNWLVSSSNTALTSGGVGLGAVDAETDYRCYWFSVGTDGDPAPMPVTQPGIPENVTLTTIDHQSATANWDAVTDADTYDLRWDIDDLFNNPTTISNIGEPPQLVNNLPTGRTIYARVRACNANGCSDWSDIASTRLIPPQAAITQRVTARHSMVLQDIDAIEVSVSQRVTARHSVEATPTMIGAIAGTVMLSGTPVEGAKVTIMHPPESDRDFDTTTTNASGQYSFDDLLVVSEGYHVSVEYRDNGNLYNTMSLPYLTPVAE